MKSLISFVCVSFIQLITISMEQMSFIIIISPSMITVVIRDARYLIFGGIRCSTTHFGQLLMPMYARIFHLTAEIIKSLLKGSHNYRILNFNAMFVSKTIHDTPFDRHQHTKWIFFFSPCFFINNKHKLPHWE